MPLFVLRSPAALLKPEPGNHRPWLGLTFTITVAVLAMGLVTVVAGAIENLLAIDGVVHDCRCSHLQLG